MRRSSITRSVLCLAFAAFAAVSAQAQHITPVSSSLGLDATAIALPPGGTQSFDSDAQSQGATLGALSASVSATDSGVSDDFGPVSVMASAAAMSVWSSAASGRVDFRPVDWTVSNGTSASLALAELWQYAFVPNRASRFDLDVNIELAGSDVRGIGTYVFRILDAQGLVHEDFFGTSNGTIPSFSEAVSFALDPGVAYTAQIRGIAGLFGVLNTRTALKDASFAFDIVEVSAVPEPSSLSMIGLGAVVLLGALGVGRIPSGKSGR